MEKDKEMKILDLPLKKEWYEMIEGGEKKEEYRETKEYWRKRLTGKHYTHVRFRYGYTKRTMLFELDSVTVGQGKPEWGAPKEKVYILHLGKRIDDDNKLWRDVALGLIFDELGLNLN